MLRIVLLVFIPYIASDFIGPGDLTIIRSEKCAEDSLDFKLEMRMKKLNRSHMGIDMYVNNPFEIGENTVINLTLAKWGDGGWKPNAVDLYDTNACKFFEKFIPDQLVSILKGFSVPESCPFPKGVHNLTSFSFSPDVNIPLMYGDFRGDAILAKDNTIFTCLRVFFKAEPKNAKAYPNV